MSEQHERVQQADLDALCPELALVVADSVRSGNAVDQTWRTLGNAVALRTARPVLEGVPLPVLRHLWYRATDDPHYWRGEVHCRLHPEWFVVLPYSPHQDEEPPAGIAAVGRDTSSPQD